MESSIRSLLQQLETDPWRREVDFSSEMLKAHEAIFAPSAKDDARLEVIRDWLQHHQPCLFGRIAAKNDFITYCVLNESDLLGTDETIQAKIQARRLDWVKSAYEGAKSGFIIICVDCRLAMAKPTNALKSLACRLASLYLRTDVVPDQAFVDQICLEKPGREQTTWRWKAGVNYFSANADGRWWRDHRFPGGIAFSMNSVGHMVKSGILAKSMKDLELALEAPPEGWETTKIDSLSKAQEFAMRTIHLAADGVSGKSTFLLKAPTDVNGEVIAGPLKGLPEFLASKNQSNYFGYYHTDYTVPSEYFLPDVERPADLEGHSLDFTYLFLDHIDNPDHITMGKGEQVREDGCRLAAESARKNKMIPEEVTIESQELLMQALKGSHSG